MAWTSPTAGADFAVNEIVTASKMNGHITDNLRYLKGLDGNVGIGPATFTAASLLHLHDTAAAGATLKLSSSAPGFMCQDHVADASRTLFGFLGFGTAAGHFGGGAGDMNFGTGALAGSQSNGIRFSTAYNTSGNYASRLFLPGGYASGAGRAGINQDTPQGIIHAQGALGRWLFYEYDGLDGTARTVVPNAAGDVVYGLLVTSLVRGSGGTIQVANSMGTVIAVGGTATLYSSGGDTAVLNVTAGGAVEIQRTAGSLTYKVSLMLMWM